MRNDRSKTRPSSAGWKRKVLIHLVLGFGIVVFGLLQGPIFGAAESLSPSGKARVDSLMRKADQRLSDGDIRGAGSVFEEVITIDPEHAVALRLLGAIYLGEGRLDEAEEVLQKSLKIEASGDTWYGLGMAAARGDIAEKRLAVTRFREALKRNPRLIDARFQLAVVLHTLEEPDAIVEMEGVVRMDSTRSAAYEALSRWVEPGLDGMQKSIEWCERGLKLHPGDPALQIRRAELKLISGKEESEAVEELLSLFKKWPKQVRRLPQNLLPRISLALIANKKWEPAYEAFRAFLDRSSPQVRAFFEDISLVGTVAEVEAFYKLEPEMVNLFLAQFWARRDVDLTSGVNRRRLEHYRRIWIAMTEFPGAVGPWDRRGEIYIRYGEPDFRQTSDDPDFEGGMDPRVRAVRRHTASRIYGPAMARGKDMKAIVNALGGKFEDDNLDTSVKSLIRGSQTQANSDEDSTFVGEFMAESFDAMSASAVDVMEFFKGPAYPVKNSEQGYTIVAAGGFTSSRWESWIYFRIGGGMEFVFTDDDNNGDYEFPGVPVFTPTLKTGEMKQLARIGLASKLRVEAPEEVFRELKMDAPALYIPETLAEPLVVDVATVDFRGVGDSSRVEVHLELPSAQFDLEGQDWSGERVVVVYDLAWREVRRSIGRSTLNGFGGFLDVAKLDLLPAEYYLAVRVKDPVSQRSRLYRNRLLAADYRGDALGVSGILLARDISPALEEGKFVRNGLRVIPVPSRVFDLEQDIYVYFEIYNLSQSSRGQTRYRVDYNVRSMKKKRGLFGRLAGRGKNRRDVTVSYEYGGELQDDTVYNALDLKKSKGGEDTLQVTVTDLNSKQKASKQTYFTLMSAKEIAKTEREMRKREARIKKDYSVAGSVDGNSERGSLREAFRKRHKVLRGGEMVYVPGAGFWIDQFEVTNAAYAEFVKETGHRVPKVLDPVSVGMAGWNKWQGKSPPLGCEDYPVVGVNWKDAVAYCEWAGKRLPKYKEWRRAAHGQKMRRYPWGRRKPNRRIANYGDMVGHPMAVGSYPDGQSAFGAFDLGGNVWEWTSTSGGRKRRVICGASWYSRSLFLQSGKHYDWEAGHRNEIIGFRCVRSDKGP